MVKTMGNGQKITRWPIKYPHIKKNAHPLLNPRSQASVNTPYVLSSDCDGSCRSRRDSLLRVGPRVSRHTAWCTGTTLSCGGCDTHNPKAIPGGCFWDLKNLHSSANTPLYQICHKYAYETPINTSHFCIHHSMFTGRSRTLTRKRHMHRRHNTLGQHDQQAFWCTIMGVLKTDAERSSGLSCHRWPGEMRGIHGRGTESHT